MPALSENPFPARRGDSPLQRQTCFCASSGAAEPPMQPVYYEGRGGIPRFLRVGENGFGGVDRESRGVSDVQPVDVLAGIRRLLAAAKSRRRQGQSNRIGWPGEV